MREGRPRPVSANPSTTRPADLSFEPVAAPTETGYLSAQQRSTIRRTVRTAIADHGAEWAARNTCPELQQKYGITYAAIKGLTDGLLPNTPPEDHLSSGQRNRLRRDFRNAEFVLPRLLQR